MLAPTHQVIVPPQNGINPAADISTTKNQKKIQNNSEWNPRTFSKKSKTFQEASTHQVIITPQYGIKPAELALDISISCWRPCAVIMQWNHWAPKRGDWIKSTTIYGATVLTNSHPNQPGWPVEGHTNRNFTSGNFNLESSFHVFADNLCFRGYWFMFVLYSG